MGLSASQARLLSITQRLNNNELESQLISNSKVQLSTQNSLATEKYIAALDSTEMSYISYDTTGISETVSLTFNSLMSYSPLKNQYNLYNSQGQLLVSEEDAMNFETSQTLSEFLMKNGLNEYWEAYNNELKEYNQKYEEYELDLKDYYLAKEEYEKELKDYYENQLPAYDRAIQKYNEDLELYNLALTAPDLYAIFSNAVGTSSTATASGSSYCYYYALNGNAGCYKHLLNYLLDYNGTTLTNHTYQTTTNKSVTTNAQGGGMASAVNKAEMKQISEALNDTTLIRYCDGDDDNNSANGQTNILKDKANPTEIDMLMSDYIKNNDGTYSLKTLKQKAIDVYYILENYSSVIDSATMKAMLINFTDGDMKKLTPTVPSLDPPPDFPTIKTSHPILPTFKYEFNYPVSDKEKAQWYTNLWYAMDGQKTAAQLGVQNDKNAVFTNFLAPDSRKTSNMEVLEKDSEGNILKAQQLNQYYTTIDKANATDSNWLQYMLTSGMVTMQQAALRTTGYVTWEGIEFSSTSDIREVQDDTKIAKAEAEYEEAISQIQAEDKILDAKVKKLDTEHSALKTEIESIKNVMTKNIEKSFNAFS